MKNKKIIIAVALSIFISSCEEEPVKPDKDFMPKTTPYGIWSSNSSNDERIAKVLIPFNQLENATDDKKDFNDFWILQDNAGFVAHNNQAFFVFNNKNTKNIIYTAEFATLAYGKFQDNLFSGKLYSLVKSQNPVDVNITTPIDNYELINIKSRFRFSYDNFEYKGSIIPTQLTYYDILKAKPNLANCKIYSLANTDGLNFSNSNLLQYTTSSFSLKSSALCSINAKFNLAYRQAGDILEFDSNLSIANCSASENKILHGNYTGVAYVASNGSKKIASAMLDGNKGIFLQCDF